MILDAYLVSRMQRVDLLEVILTCAFLIRLGGIRSSAPKFAINLLEGGVSSRQAWQGTCKVRDRRRTNGWPRHRFALPIKREAKL